eukprot:TRINITY_DN36425_c0_g1_i1.p1 TRINITY_DN36425_c0_g1~~TRINITY_DN36425_c0_g1_i1.p1  ORF type:complete len:880 (-),score=156.04 TRINITY_DN36425_c0_g1_i1:143-2782(-)
MWRKPGMWWPKALLLLPLCLSCCIVPAAADAAAPTGGGGHEPESAITAGPVKPTLLVSWHFWQIPQEVNVVAPSYSRECDPRHPSFRLHNKIQGEDFTQLGVAIFFFATVKLVLALLLTPKVPLPCLSEFEREEDGMHYDPVAKMTLETLEFYALVCSAEKVLQLWKAPAKQSLKTVADIMLSFGRHPEKALCDTINTAGVQHTRPCIRLKFKLSVDKAKAFAGCQIYLKHWSGCHYLAEFVVDVPSGLTQVAPVSVDLAFPGMRDGDTLTLSISQKDSTKVLAPSGAEATDSQVVTLSEIRVGVIEEDLSVAQSLGTTTEDGVKWQNARCVTSGDAECTIWHDDIHDHTGTLCSHEHCIGKILLEKQGGTWALCPWTAYSHHNMPDDLVDKVHIDVISKVAWLSEESFPIDAEEDKLGHNRKLCKAALAFVMGGSELRAEQRASMVKHRQSWLAKLLSWASTGFSLPHGRQLPMEELEAKVVQYVTWRLHGHPTLILGVDAPWTYRMQVTLFFLQSFQILTEMLLLAVAVKPHWTYFLQKDWFLLTFRAEILNLTCLRAARIALTCVRIYDFFGCAMHLSAGRILLRAVCVAGFCWLVSSLPSIPALLMTVVVIAFGVAVCAGLYALLARLETCLVACPEADGLQSEEQGYVWKDHIGPLFVLLLVMIIPVVAPFLVSIAFRDFSADTFLCNHSHMPLWSVHTDVLLDVDTWPHFCVAILVIVAIATCGSFLGLSSLVGWSSPDTMLAVWFGNPTFQQTIYFVLATILPDEAGWADELPKLADDLSESDKCWKARQKVADSWIHKVEAAFHTKDDTPRQARPLSVNLGESSLNWNLLFSVPKDRKVDCRGKINKALHGHSIEWLAMMRRRQRPPLASE